MVGTPPLDGQAYDAPVNMVWSVSATVQPETK